MRFVAPEGNCMWTTSGLATLNCENELNALEPLVVAVVTLYQGFGFVVGVLGAETVVAVLPFGVIDVLAGIVAASAMPTSPLARPAGVKNIKSTRNRHVSLMKKEARPSSGLFLNPRSL